MASTRVAVSTDVIAAAISWTSRKHKAIQIVADRLPDGTTCVSTGGHGGRPAGTGYGRTARVLLVG